jgi:dTDP-4-dehydrorhamnose reductase
MKRGSAEPRVLVLGVTGMLGHKVFQTLQHSLGEVIGVMRAHKTAQEIASFDFLHSASVLDGVDLTEWAAVKDVLVKIRPDVVVNCVGVIKQRAEATSPITSISINALLPHLLAEHLASSGGRLVHVSSDCVFSGLRGQYSEDDLSDADDLYGRTKYLGEVATANAITLRTSIIGRELMRHDSLLDWFLQQRGRRIRGYRKAMWSGTTTNHLAEIISLVISKHPQLSGLFQLSSGRLSKHDLLLRLREAYDLDVEIIPDDDVRIDRTLRGERFAAAIGYRAPDWSVLTNQLTSDTTVYPHLGEHTEKEI